MSFLDKVEAVGWGFFAGASALLSPLCIWLVWQSAKPEATIAERVLLGIVMATILSAVLAWLLNDQLYRRALRRQGREEKAETQKKPAK